jgi:CubicO group peptidase (beta-lactamase class C family)
MMAKILSRYSVNTLLFITLMVVLFSSASATAENRYTRTEYDISQLSDFPIKQLNRDINHIINQHKQAANRPFNGVIMVSRADDVLYQYASSNEFDAETLLSRQQYVVGSISKTITAILVMQAVDEQLIKLDDVAVRYLDNQIDPQITIAHLLSHTSGIQTKQLLVANLIILIRAIYY